MIVVVIVVVVVVVAVVVRGCQAQEVYPQAVCQVAPQGAAESK